MVSSSGEIVAEAKAVDSSMPPSVMASQSSGSRTRVGGTKRDKICVACGEGIKATYREYSPGNIRLARCRECERTADPYIEFQFVLILIDMILQRRSAYRHVLFNRYSSSEEKRALVRSICNWLVVYCFLDSVATRCIKNPTGLLVGDRPWEAIALHMVVTSLHGLAYVTGVVVAAMVLLRPSVEELWCLLRAIAVSSFGKAACALTLVWTYPPVFNHGVTFFILASNMTAICAVFRVSRLSAFAMVGVGFFFNAVARVIGSLIVGAGPSSVAENWLDNLTKWGSSSDWGAAAPAS